MSNQYWPIYKKLERNFDNLTHSIHIVDNQMDVYSSDIADMIMRIGSEIESITKALYRLHIDANANNISFDEDALKSLSAIWKLDKKVVVLSHPNCFLTEVEYLPFAKTVRRTGKSRMTFS